jgi:hypothetical protein
MNNMPHHYEKKKGERVFGKGKNKKATKKKQQMKKTSKGKKH